MDTPWSWPVTLHLRPAGLAPVVVTLEREDIERFRDDPRTPDRQKRHAERALAGDRAALRVCGFNLAPRVPDTFTLDLTRPHRSLLEQTGWPKTELARRLGITKQAINERLGTEDTGPRGITVPMVLDMLDKCGLEIQLVLVRKKST